MQENIFFLIHSYIAHIAGKQRIKNSCEQFSILQFIYNLMPVMKWLPEYSIKNYFPGDVTAGITVAVMHIPQGENTLAFDLEI